MRGQWLQATCLGKGVSGVRPGADLVLICMECDAGTDPFYKFVFVVGERNLAWRRVREVIWGDVPVPKSEISRLKKKSR